MLFVSCRGREPIEMSYLFRSQNNSRNSTWNCNFVNMILRNRICTPTNFLKPIKDIQQHTVVPSCAKYLYITDREWHVCVIQNRKCNALQTGSWLNNLKEQYPVNAHAPNFDFWTGCREIKRCEESKRTFKNPFASHLAGFNMTLKLLRITDQWYIVPVKFRFGRNLDFFGVTFIAVGRRTKRLEASYLAGFNMTLKLLRITDQWYIVPVKFRFGRNLDFFGVTFIAVGRRTKRLEALWCRLKAYFFC